MSAAMESSPPPPAVEATEPQTSRRSRRETTKEKARRLLVGMFEEVVPPGPANAAYLQAVAHHVERAGALLGAFKDEPERVTARRLAKAVFAVTRR